MSSSRPPRPLRREFLTRAASLQVRESGAPDGEPSRVITGYAIVFNTPSEPLWEFSDEVAREVIEPGAITRELLDSSDIKFTMFHDRQLILARSNRGAGTLTYSIDDHGVSFEFEAPHTADGDKALELVRRGDLAGCSFAFSLDPDDPEAVERRVEAPAGSDGPLEVTYHVRRIAGIYDMTLAADPAYPATDVEARQLRESLTPAADDSPAGEEEAQPIGARLRPQARALREASRRRAL